MCKIFYTWRAGGVQMTKLIIRPHNEIQMTDSRARASPYWLRVWSVSKCKVLSYCSKDNLPESLQQHKMLRSFDKSVFPTFLYQQTLRFTVTGLELCWNSWNCNIETSWRFSTKHIASSSCYSLWSFLFVSLNETKIQKELCLKL